MTSEGTLLEICLMHLFGKELIKTHLLRRGNQSHLNLATSHSVQISPPRWISSYQKSVHSDTNCELLSELTEIWWKGKI